MLFTVTSTNMSPKTSECCHHKHSPCHCKQVQVISKHTLPAHLLLTHWWITFTNCGRVDWDGLFTMTNFRFLCSI